MFTSAARSVSAEAPSNAALSEGDVVVAATGAGVGTSLCGAGITAADAAFLMGDCCGSAAGGGDADGPTKIGEMSETAAEGEAGEFRAVNSSKNITTKTPRRSAATMPR